MENYTYSREHIEEIWRRVMPNSDLPAGVLDALPERAAPSCSAKDTHSAAIKSELFLMTFYRELSNMATSRVAARKLCCMANEQLTNAKTAAAAYFFLYGEYFFPIEELGRPVISGFREGLRYVWNEERRLASEYIAYSERPDVQGDLGLLSLAHEHSQHSLALRALVEDSM